ncbi:MAG: hypothetical protein ACXVY6_05560 [Gaiellaceae bacterium]
MGKSRMLRPQPWDWPRPRVLLELPDGQASSGRIDALRRAGYAVAVCPGPTAEGGCPLAGDEDCAVAHGADIVVSGLGLETAVAREPLAALRRRLPDLPVLVEADAETAARWPDLVREEERLEPGIDPFELVGRVRGALVEEPSASA